MKVQVKYENHHIGQNHVSMISLEYPEPEIQVRETRIPETWIPETWIPETRVPET